jgi:small subunit ribosomal protein S17
MFKKKEQKNTENKETKENKGKVLVGVVTSNKMDKTAVVRVDQYKKHPKYQKYVSSKKSYKIHDEENSLDIGDKVEIVETNPISKDKRFKLSNIIEKSATVDLNDDK